MAFIDPTRVGDPVLVGTVSIQQVYIEPNVEN